MLGSNKGLVYNSRLAYSPPQDAVQEVRVKAFDADAAYGHTGSGTVNLIMKTGTNALNTTETSSSFGQITTQLNRPRQIQLGGRLVF